MFSVNRADESEEPDDADAGEPAEPQRDAAPAPAKSAGTGRSGVWGPGFHNKQADVNDLRRDPVCLSCALTRATDLSVHLAGLRPPPGSSR